MDEEISIAKSSTTKTRRDSVSGRETRQQPQGSPDQVVEALAEIAKSNPELVAGSPKVGISRRRSMRVSSKVAEMSPLKATSLVGSFTGVLSAMRGN